MAAEMAAVPVGETLTEAPGAPAQVEGHEPGRVREVTGYEDTFEEAVAEGLIPTPPLLFWNGWQAWRREHGGRPTTADDGQVPRPRDEAALWRRVMAHYHGPDWGEALRAGRPAGPPK